LAFKSKSEVILKVWSK